MSTQELTYEITEGEDGQRLVATIDIPEREFPLQVGVAVHVADTWVVILWDDCAAGGPSSASFKSEDRATALQVLDFHAALVTRLVSAQAVTA
ncbi:hypothetical protein JVX93_15730 [Mycolicibacterium boenickei]|nr:hypothetical protein JVX93_15730 [Mycolicibacterium boenickei]